MSRENRIKQIIVNELNPSFLEVVNESHKHHVPDGAETHFKLSIVTNQFTGVSKIARHRLVNNLLAGELTTGLHALSLHLHTPEEWEKSNRTQPDSPACRDGYRHG